MLSLSDKIFKSFAYIDIAIMVPNKLDKFTRDVIHGWPLEDLAFIAITGGYFENLVLVDRISSPLRDDSVPLHAPNMCRHVVLEV